MGSRLKLGDLCDIDEKLWKRGFGGIYCRGTGAAGWKMSRVGYPNDK